MSLSSHLRGVPKRMIWIEWFNQIWIWIKTFGTCCDLLTFAWDYHETLRPRHFIKCFSGIILGMLTWWIQSNWNARNWVDSKYGIILWWYCLQSVDWNLLKEVIELRVFSRQCMTFIWQHNSVVINSDVNSFKIYIVSCWRFNNWRVSIFVFV